MGPDRTYRTYGTYMTFAASSLVPKLHLGTHLSAKLCFTRPHCRPRSQSPSGNALGRATPSPRPNKKLRHPERSEASGLFSPCRSARAQSKDLADFPCDRRGETDLLHAGPARRHGMELFPRIANRAGKTTRSFDCGSANALGETNAPLAFAQDDGVLKRARAVGIGSEAGRTSVFPGATGERGEKAT